MALPSDAEEAVETCASGTAVARFSSICPLRPDFSHIDARERSATNAAANAAANAAGEEEDKGLGEMEKVQVRRAGAVKFVAHFRAILVGTKFVAYFRVFTGTGAHPKLKIGMLCPNTIH